MKKIILLAAFGCAALVSAKESIKEKNDKKVVVELSAKESIKEKNDKKIVVAWCGTVTYHTSCGLPIQDSYCTSWGMKCLIDSMNLLDEYYCG